MRIRSLFIGAIGIALGLLGNHLVRTPSVWDVRADAFSYESQVLGASVLAFLVLGLVLFIYDFADWFRNRRRAP